MMNKLPILIVLLGLTACSNRSVYETIRMNQRNACLEAQPSRPDACMERLNKSFDEYERERGDELGEGS
ncbi:MAG: hypothetical protein RLW62_12695 [Gammaproteobacteria bacterium]